MRKFSFFRPVMMSPFEVVAATSIVTSGTSTEMETPPEGAGCCPAGLCGFCDGGGFCCGCWPGCGLGGACAAAGVWLSVANRLANSTAEETRFIPSPILDQTEKTEPRNSLRQ